MKKKPIDQATDAELRQFAIHMQIEDVGKAKTRPDLISLLGTVWDENYVLVADELVDDQNEAAKPAVQRASTSEAYFMDPMVELTIGQTSMVGGRQPAMPSVNGKTLVINRNVRVEVPYRFYKVLAKSVRGEVDERGNTTDVTNYPLQIHKMPSQEEIDAWHEATRGLEIA